MHVAGFDLNSLLGATRQKRWFKVPSARRTAFAKKPRQFAVPRQNPQMSPGFKASLSQAWKGWGWTK